MWRRKRPAPSVVPSTAAAPTPSTSVTSTTVVSSSATVAATPRLRGETLGISAGSYASTAVLDACVDLGVGWVRFSVECGWANALAIVADTTRQAHQRGLKVVHVIQAGNGHRYDDPTSNAALVKYAQDCVTYANVDCCEIGNEWNHKPFWIAPTYSIMPPSAQAQLSLSVASGVRSVNPTVPIITNGLSPEANDQNPYIWLRSFWDVALAAHQTVGWSGIGLHPYCYPELATTNPAQWNPLAQVPTIVADAAMRGLRLPVWLTELGAPGFASNAPVIRNVALTEDQQRLNYEAYISAIKAHEASGLRFPLVCFATMFDGQSQTTAVEGGLGLRRADGTRKPAWGTVRQFALEPLPA